MLPLLAVALAALILAPVGADAADLVVWWEEGYYAQEDQALAEIIAAFERKTGKQVELIQPSQADFPAEAQAAVLARQPPDFLFGIGNTPTYLGQWAYEDRLVDLSAEILPFKSLFDPDALAAATLFDATPVGAPSMRCRLAFIPTMSTSGATCSSRSGSPWTTSQSSGTRFGRSGATRSSRRCAARPGAKTSGGSAWSCRPRRLMIQASNSNSSSRPTTQTT